MESASASCESIRGLLLVKIILPMIQLGQSHGVECPLSPLARERNGRCGIPFESAIRYHRVNRLMVLLS